MHREKHVVVRYASTDDYSETRLFQLLLTYCTEALTKIYISCLYIHKHPRAKTLIYKQMRHIS